VTGPTRPRGSGNPEGREPRPQAIDREPADKRRGMERVADLLPQAAREFGLEDQLEQARAAARWQSIIAERVPAAAGMCRLIGLEGGIATVEADQPIVAQELRLRSPELLAALRATTRTPIRQLRVTARHV
jgi:predicted nucleic acid-binding Zn ribbon protein